MLSTSHVFGIQSSRGTSDLRSLIFFAAWLLSFGRYNAKKFERFRWHKILSLVYWIDKVNVINWYKIIPHPRKIWSEFGIRIFNILQFYFSIFSSFPSHVCLLCSHIKVHPKITLTLKIIQFFAFSNGSNLKSITAQKGKAFGWDLTRLREFRNISIKINATLHVVRMSTDQGAIVSGHALIS